MRVSHNFRKLYAPVVEGIDPNAIISYGKRPYEQFMPYRNSCFYRFQHTLIIDLWIVAFRFDWRDSDAKIEKIRAREKSKYLASIQAFKDR